MKKKLVVLFGALFALLMMPLTARAANCDQRVVDDGGLYGGRIAEVNAAASTLSAKGADVRVRTTRNYGGFANLDQYEASIVANCLSWRGANGKIKSNLLVFMLSTGTKTSSGIYYGGVWSSTLNAKWPTIQAQEVNPLLSSNNPQGRDFVGGTVKGLNSIAVAIGASAAVAAPVQPAPYQPAPARPAPPPVVVQTQPTDLTGLWFVMAGVLGLVAIGALIWFIFYRKGRSEEAKTAQQKANVAKSACSAKVIDLAQDVDLLLIPKIEKAGKSLSEEDIVSLLGDAQAVKAAYGSASSRFADLNSSATDPSRDGLSAPEYEEIANGFNDVLASLEQVRQLKDAIDNKIAEFQRLVGDAPKQIADAERAITSAATDIEEVGKAGFLAGGALKLLGEAGNVLSEAQGALATKRFGKVGGFVKQAKDKAKAASDAAKALTTKKKQADSDIAYLAQRITDSTASVSSAKETLQQIKTTYVEGSWKDIGANGAALDEAFSEAKRQLAAATTAASMEKQNWDACSVAIANGNAAVDRANETMGAIRGRQTDLEKAKRDASPALDQIVTNIGEVRQYIRTHAGDIDPSVAMPLPGVETSVQHWRAELEKKTPDYRALVTSAARQKEVVANVFKSAKDQVATAEAQRQEAANAISVAEEAIEAIALYVEQNRRDVGVASDRCLGEARELLGQAKATKELTAKIDFARKAKAKTGYALNIAQDEIAEGDRMRRAEQQRLDAIEEARAAEARRQADASNSLLTGIVIGSALSNSSRDSDRYGGSGSSWGGGGGSSSGGGSSNDYSSGDSGGGGGSTDVDDSSSSGGGYDGGGGSSDSGSSGGDSGGGGSSDAD